MIMTTATTDKFRDAKVREIFNHPIFGFKKMAMSLFFLLVLHSYSAANDFSPARVEKIRRIEIDGYLTEEAWQQATAITSWYQQTPDEGSPPSQRTEMWLLYDQEYLYLGARLHENEPSKLAVRRLERDSFSREEDGICILLDTYNDDRTAYAFIVTPGGVRTDLAISNDGEGYHGSQNKEWDAFWDAAVSRDDAGWYAELRIPFSSLRFESNGSAVEMGMILWRYLARNSEYDVFPRIPNHWRNSAYKPSQALDIRFDGIAAHNPVYIKPYGLGGITQINELRSDETAYERIDDWERNVGLDVKYNLTSNLIFDLTLNTDFAQVEVDEQRINTTRFSLFFPEKRDFFQERSELFSFRFPGGPQRMFQSRRIGIVEGVAVPILGGLRLTGRIGRWDVGLIEMQTDRAVLEDGEAPAENFGVLRLRREVFEPGSYVGGLVTTRTDFQGNNNIVYGVDTDIRIFEQQYAQLKFSQSFEPGAQLAKSWYGSLTLQRRIRRGFTHGTSVSHYGSQYHPGVGFLNRPGVDRFGSRMQYTWFPGSANRLQNHGLSNRFSFIWTADDSHALETFDDRFSWDGLFKSGARAQISVQYVYENLTEAFDIGAVEILPGRYGEWGGSAEYESPSGDDIRYKIEGGYGGYFGGRRIRLQASPSWTPSRHLSLRIDYEYNRIDVANQVFNAHLLRFRVRTAVNRALTLNAFLQYNSNDAELSSNIRLRYNPAEGNDLYLVYNENANTSREPENALLPRLPRMQNRSVLVKYTYTLVR